METVEIFVSTQNNWWVERQVQRTYRIERLLNHILNVILLFILFLHLAWAPPQGRGDGGDASPQLRSLGHHVLYPPPPQS